MIFDRLCGIVERHFPEYRKLLADARLFFMDSLDKQSPSDHRDDPFKRWEFDEQLAENLRLPFDCIAIDDGKSCTMLSTLDAERRRYQAISCDDSAARGCMFSRCELIAFPSGFQTIGGRFGKACAPKDLDVYSIKGSSVKEVLFSMSEIERGGDSSHSFLGGSVARVESKRDEGVRFWVAGSPVAVEDVPKNRQIRKHLRDIADTCAAEIDILLANAAYFVLVKAMAHLLWICQPSTFVVEERSLDWKLPDPNKKNAARSHQRERYIVLNPKDIKRRFLYDDADPSGIPRAPHERRGHYRKLTSERFVSKRNHIVWVKPCWVGKTEAVRGKNKYIVRLDV